ncbi:uncharacterized protein DFL_007780 [Arthrobotrys flagrans]|uniref:Uncharacterized protein n=1 Tax=Arthrobotrys flagrans TaxID=97331 RepID=A0A436ZXG4_ARTFL|nr:hypothetical protein DFL_007780 [Arthrobotrys flagrans]
MPCEPQVWPRLDWFQGRFDYAATETERECLRSTWLQIIKTQDFVERDAQIRSANYVERDPQRLMLEVSPRMWSYS